jgi:kynurenine formamidase
MPRQFVEVSHPIEAGMKTYPGLPEPAVQTLLDYDSSRERYEGQAEFFIASLHLCGNTGTYVDSPRHRYRSGADLAGIPLEAVAHVPVIKVDVRSHATRAVGAEVFDRSRLAGRAVLINTGWDRFWRQEPYFENNPFLTREAARLLADSGARFVGIDSLNIDDIGDLARPAHSILLGAGIPICEHMTHLDQLQEEGGFLHAVPIAWVGGASFPVRAYVIYSAESLL